VILSYPNLLKVLQNVRVHLFKYLFNNLIILILRFFKNLIRKKCILDTTSTKEYWDLTVLNNWISSPKRAPHFYQKFLLF